eukprot:GILI01026604.1.p2 GENE.GILI01026604.1~~GILI01026604.1.p2  ORF type:complete len:181 (+),score=59.54 GILI01026604.1:265-807(+)
MHPQLLKEGELSEAVGLFTEVSKSSDEAFRLRGLAGLVECAVEDGSVDMARELLAKITESKAPAPALAHPDVVRATAVLSLADLIASIPAPPADATLKSLSEAVAAEPLNHPLRFGLAVELFRQQRHQEAINQALLLFRKGRDWQEGAGRKLALAFFDILGKNESVVVEGRKRLTSLLFI